MRSLENTGEPDLHELLEQLPRKRWKLLAAFALEASKDPSYEHPEHCLASYLAQAYERGRRDAIKEMISEGTDAEGQAWGASGPG